MFRPCAELLSLRGQVAWVTGASGGIGAAIAKRLADAGAQVVLQGRAPGSALQALRQELAAAGHQAGISIVPLDSPAAARAAVDALLQAQGRLDLLINAAGLYPSTALEDLTAAEWRAVFGANLDQAFHALQAAAAPMRRQGRGVILNIGSISATQPAAAMAHYNASKAALLSLTKSAAQELGPHGIRVNAVSPGLIRRPGLAEAWPEGVARWQARAPLQRLGEPDDVACACLFLASEAAAWITGQELVVDGGVSVAPAY